MKRTKAVVLIVFMAMIMVVSSGCVGDKSSDTIKKWEPKNKEDAAVIGMLTRDSGYSVVEFETSKEMKNVSLGYDYYKGGKFIKDCKCGRVEQIENSKTEGLAGVAFEEGKYITFYSEKKAAVVLSQVILKDGKKVMQVGWDSRVLRTKKHLF